jgi:periodic tryptophan protein 2
VSYLGLRVTGDGTDDRYFLSTSRDMTARMYTLDPLEGFKPKSFGGHRDAVLGAWFSADEKTVCLLLVGS